MRRNDGFLLGVLLSVSFLGQTAISLLNLALIFYVKNVLLLDAALVGVFASVGPVSYCITLIALKPLHASLKPRHGILAASAGFVIIPAAIVLAESVLFAFLSYALYGLCLSLFWPAVMGWVSRGREQRELGRRMGQFNVSWSVGVILGPYWAGVIAEHSAAYAVLASSGFALLITLLIGFSSIILPAVKHEQSRSTLKAESSAADASTPLRYLCWFGLFTGYFIFGVTMNIFPMHAQDVLQFSEGTIGLLMLLRGMTATLFFYLLGRMHYWHHNATAVIMLQAVTVAVCLFGIVAESFFALSVFMLLFGICFAHLYGFAIFHGVSGSIDREFRMALHEAVLTLGLFAGSSLGGLLYARVSFALTMTAAAGAGTAGLIMQILLHRVLLRRPKRGTVADQR